MDCKESRWLLFGLALLTVGCGDNGMPMTPVAGKVTFDGGPPPNAGNLSFVSIESTAGLPQRDGSCRFETDGKFVVTSFEKGDGLLPGKYRVEASCYKYQPDYSKKDPFADATAVDPSYKPIELSVEKGVAQKDLVIDLPLKK
jgi:hypothetical protein